MTSEPMQPLRHSVAESAQMLRISQALMYRKISDGVIRAQRDGSRSYITHEELQRYVASLESSAPPTPAPPRAPRPGRRPRAAATA
jgi:excisionase family DNA binding protein